MKQGMKGKNIMRCPVCNATCAENDNTCQRCHWEFEIFISDISEHTKNAKHKKLRIAQQKWKKRVLLAKKKKKEQMVANQPQSSAPKTNHHQYSDKTPVPELNRDPFETFEEFAERINNYPPIPAGKVKLIKKDYSFHIGEFPIQVTWDDWTKNIKGMPSIKQTFCIHVSPDLAQQLYQSNESHTLFIKLKSAKNDSALGDIEIFWNDRPILAQQYTGIMKPFKNESKTDFQNRISSLNDIQIGEGTLIKEKYDITNGTFPLKIKIDQWFKDYFSVSINKLQIIAEINIAREIFEHRRVYPIKAQLTINGFAISIERVYLYAKNMSFLIENMKAEMLGKPPRKKYKKKSLQIENMNTYVYSVSENLIIETTKKKAFIFVPGGRFQMGDIFNDGIGDATPVHDVKLDSFYIGKYPVTQGQWKKVMNNNPSLFKKGDNYPVETVFWEATQEFIKRLNEMNKDTQYEFRLPTEAEWEYAARSGGKKEKYAGGNNLDELAWYGKNSCGTTHPVGEKMPNGLGLYDMSGNVWEWCEDAYFENAYRMHDKDNPVYLESKTGSRVLRGGAWYIDAKGCRSASRRSGEPGGWIVRMGFRLVFSLRSVN